MIDEVRLKNAKEEVYLRMEPSEDRKMGSEVEWRIVLTCSGCVQRGKYMRAEEIAGK